MCILQVYHVGYTNIFIFERGRKKSLLTSCKTAYGKDELTVLIAPEEAAIYAGVIWGSLNNLKSEETKRGEWDWGRATSHGCGTESYPQCLSSGNRAVTTHRRGVVTFHYSVKGNVLLGELERGPGLLGSVATHLPRAGELESIWDKGETKNKA